jgi:Bacterial PH domain
VPAPSPAPVSAVPRRLRLICAVTAAVVTGVLVAVGLLLPSTTNTVVSYGFWDQVGLIGVGLLVGAGILLLGRARVDADTERIRVRNLAVRHDLPWTAVRAVRFDRSSAWASLLLENDDEVSLLAVQAADKEYAVQAVEGLRALHSAAREAARAAEPARPPLLYDD